VGRSQWWEESYVKMRVAWLFIAVAAVVGITLTGCGQGIAGPAANRGQFESYFQQFETDSVAQGRSTFGDDAIPISLATLNTTEAGRCVWGLLSGRQIYIDQVKWPNLDPNTRQALIDHELGHCLLNRVHTSDTISSLTASAVTASALLIPFARLLAEESVSAIDDFSVPKSIMDPNALTGSTYWTYRPYYIQELFSSQ
jgi:hypothetical protein